MLCRNVRINSPRPIYHNKIWNIPIENMRGLCYENRGIAYEGEKWPSKYAFKKYAFLFYALFCSYAQYNYQ